jgi:hypothetical protein
LVTVAARVREHFLDRHAFLLGDPAEDRDHAVGSSSRRMSILSVPPRISA